MDRYHIIGGNRLEGDCSIKGAKNALLPILAASLLSGRESIIHNCPKLRDVKAMLTILDELGCTAEISGDTIIVDSSGLSCHRVHEALASQMRSSLFLIGPLLARCKKVSISYPGGCQIGLRPIDIHLKALRQLGIAIEENHGYLDCDGSRLKSCAVQLDFPSVGATENIMMVAVLAKGTTKIQNAAKEPEILDLQNFLNRMGAKITGAGTEEISIEGVEKLQDVEYSVMADRIVTGTLMVAAAVTGGEISIRDAESKHLGLVNSKLVEAGCKVIETANELYIKAPKRLHSIDMIKTLPYPGFPTDMQSQFLTMMTMAKGTSVICETVFENRFMAAEELTKMGAKIVVDGRMAVINGIDRLMGAKVHARDLRGGAALVIAGLAAEGETQIEDIYHIDRGYENIESSLARLGANIVRIKDHGEKQREERKENNKKEQKEQEEQV